MVRDSRGSAWQWMNCLSVKAARRRRPQILFAASDEHLLFVPPGSWLTGSMTFVLRSTAKTIVRCSAPSRLLATIGRTWRRSGRLKRTANVPSLRILTGSPRSVTWASGWVTP